MSQENVDALKRALNAFNRADVPAFLDALDPAVELEWGTGYLPWGDTYRGHAGVKDWLKGFGAWRGFRFELEEIVVDQDPYVVAVLRMEAEGRSSGVPVELPGPGLFEIRDGKIVRMAAYEHVEQALEAAGLRE
jgi:ketosteroid isomerase-like protein